MIGRLLFPLCLCCVVLCAFVGYLSKRAIKEAEQVATEVVELDCGSLIEKPPYESTGVLLSDYVFIDEIASIDIDGDGKWDEVAVPLFSKEVFKAKASYQSVIARFRDVPDLETLKQRLAVDALKANYRVSEQTLDSNLHAMLAKKFKNMDFEKSPVVAVGYGESNPVLGEKSLEMSYQVGAIAIAVGVLSLVFSVLTGVLKSFTMPQQPSRRPMAMKKKKKKKKTSSQKKTSNRSGPPNYDVEPTGGVLDRVRSMRDEQPSP